MTNSANFQTLLIKAYHAIKNKQFDKAVITYKELKEKYDKLNQNRQTPKLKKDILVLFGELTLYMKINEAYIMAKQGDLVALKLALDQINELHVTNDEAVPDVKLLLNYSKNKFCLDVYTYKFTLKEFESLYDKIKELSNQRKINEAIRDFAHLLLAYNTIIRNETYENRMIMHKKIMELLTDIEVKGKLFNIYQNKVIPELKEIPVKLKAADKKLETHKVDKNIMYKKINEEVKKGEYSHISKTF